MVVWLHGCMVVWLLCMLRFGLKTIPETESYFDCVLCLIHVNQNICGCLCLILSTSLVKATHYSDLTGGHFEYF